MSDRTPLPQLAQKLFELTGETGPGYQFVHRLITGGRLPSDATISATRTYRGSPPC